MLYRPEAFEPLTETTWESARVRAGIRQIVDDTDGAFDLDGLWPAHEWDAWQTPLPLKTLYTGAAGVVWALDVLRRRGHAESSIDLPEAALRTVERWREEPDLMRGVELPRHAEAGLLSGETGVLLVASQITGDERLAGDLRTRVRESIRSEANEVMWGAPGALVAAAAMWRWTGDERWADTWRDVADAVWGEREADGLWTVHLYGEDYRGLTPPHGLVGNAQALLGGRELLGDERRESLRRDTREILARTAVVEDGLANWPGAEGEGLVAADRQIRLQWCNGAPGIVIAAGDYLDEDLLLAGAGLTWRAGPPTLEKGSGICHGTAAGGYALLKAFERTGDELWLERARRFAVHALEQFARARTEAGRGRYALWTGDAGTALYAAACLDANAAYPILDAD